MMQMTRAESLRQLERRLKPQRLGGGPDDTVSEACYNATLSERLCLQLYVPTTWPELSAWAIVTKSPLTVDDCAAEEQLEGLINDELDLSTRTILQSLNKINAQLDNLIKTAISRATERKNAESSRAIQLDPPVAGETESKSPNPGYAFFRIDDAIQHYVPDGSDVEHSSAKTSESDEADRAWSDSGSEASEFSSIAYATTQQKGTALDCQLTLGNISLLEPKSLRLSVRCFRCRQQHVELPAVPAGGSCQTVCPRCSAALSATYRPQVLHSGNDRLGYLDLQGAVVESLGPSSFLATCQLCSRADDLFKGLAPEQPQTRPCRGCHSRLQVEIAKISFLQISAESLGSLTRRIRTRRKDELRSVVRGTPLPDEGRCKHFRKSYRWLRFGCCGRVFACDRCHDALADHIVSDQARSQICGRCSRESAILAADKPCPYCGRPFYKRRRAGFWEGGKGVRERQLLNRNDPRKHRKKI
ncbi:hypothetical protein PYCC9005_000011 [Savitreella phatthalungensis]